MTRTSGSQLSRRAGPPKPPRRPETTYPTQNPTLGRNRRINHKSRRRHRQLHRGTGGEPGHGATLSLLSAVIATQAGAERAGRKTPCPTTTRARQDFQPPPTSEREKTSMTPCRTRPQNPDQLLASQTIQNASSQAPAPQKNLDNCPDFYRYPNPR